MTLKSFPDCVVRADRPVEPSDGAVSFLYLSNMPPYFEGGWDPRPRELYATGVSAVWLAPRGASEIPLWSQSRRILDCDFVSPLLLRHGNREALITSVRQALRDWPQAILIVKLHEVAILLGEYGVPYVFDPTDSRALYFLRRFLSIFFSDPLRAANAIRMTALFIKRERSIALCSSAFIVAGRADEQFLRFFTPRACILRIGNGTDRVNQPPVEPVDDARTVGFHGNMTWYPNQLTATRLAALARRLNPREKPEYVIDIVGGPVCSHLAKYHGKHGVRIRGFVHDLTTWFASLSLYVMPMYAGAGVKNKLIEAMALGVPVVTNELGAEALEEDGRDAVAVVKNDRHLVETIRALLADPQRLSAMRKAGRRHAEKHYRWETHREKLHSELSRLKAAGRL